MVRTLQVHGERLWSVLEGSVAQAADLAEHLMLSYRLDYRSAYRIVGHAVHTAIDHWLRGVVAFVTVSSIDGLALLEDSFAREAVTVLEPHDFWPPQSARAEIVKI